MSKKEINKTKNKVLRVIKLEFSNMVNVIKDLKTSIKNKNIKNIKEKDKKEKKKFIYGIVGILIITLIPISIYGNYIDKREKEQLTVDLFLSYLIKLQENYPESNINKIKINQVFVAKWNGKGDSPHKDYMGVSYSCMDMSFPESKISNQRLKLCIESNDGRNIDGYLAGGLLTIDIVTNSTTLSWNTIVNIDKDHTLYAIEELNSKKVEKLLNKKFNPYKLEQQSSSNSIIEDEDNLTEQKEQEEKKSYSTDKTFMTPNKHLLPLSTTDEIISKLNSKEKEIIFFVNKDYSDVDNMFEILQKISDNYGINISYYNLDNMTSEDESRLYSIIQPDTWPTSYNYIPPLLAELNGEMTVYRPLEEYWTYDFYVSALINNMFLERQSN